MSVLCQAMIMRLTRCHSRSMREPAGASAAGLTNGKTLHSRRRCASPGRRELRAQKRGTAERDGAPPSMTMTSNPKRQSELAGKPDVPGSAHSTEPRFRSGGLDEGEFIVFHSHQNGALSHGIGPEDLSAREIFEVPLTDAASGARRK